MLRRSSRWVLLLVIVSAVFITSYIFDVRIVHYNDIPAPIQQPIEAVDPPQYKAYGGGSLAPENPLLSRQEVRKALVVASMSYDETGWIQENFPDWEANIYVVDSKWPRAPFLKVVRNKGREANVYLTYIIDNYSQLPDFMFFMHALRYQWHNEDPMYDGVPMIRNLRLEHVQAAGYVNARCTWMLGCPHELKDLRASEAPRRTDRGDLPQNELYPAAFQQLFPEKELPETVGAPCGAQFAVSKEAVLARPKEDYIHFRQWLWDSTEPDSTSGRVLEYSWHILFGKNATDCPPAEECFCRTYGLCDLDCPTEGRCEKRYILAPFSTIPENWPNSGVEGTLGWPAKDWFL